MLESHPVEGRQDDRPGRPIVYGQSITDACISLEQTEPLLDLLGGRPLALGPLGLGDVFFFQPGEIGHARGFSLSVLALVQVGLMVAALPDLFAKKMSTWTRIFYSQLVGVALSLLAGSIVVGLIGGLIGLYILFQIRPLYRT